MVHFYYSPLSIYMYFLSAYYLLILCFFLLTYKGFGDLKDQRKNLRSNSDKIVSLPTRIKKEYNGNKRLSSPSSERNS